MLGVCVLPPAVQPCSQLTTLPSPTTDADLQVCLTPVLTSSGGSVEFILEVPTAVDLSAYAAVGAVNLQGGAPCTGVAFDPVGRLLQGR
jgi:hypothetical protein